MITKSFIFLDGITENSEKKLWSMGIMNWDDFLNTKNIFRISNKRKLFYDSKIRRAKKLLHNNITELINLFPNNQHWRFYNYIKEKIAIDIETSQYYGDITVLGISNEEETKFLLKNKNLSEHYLKNIFKEPSIIFSFNGKSFDIPIIIKKFPKLKVIMNKQAHIDIRHVASKLGYVGGLKKIEKDLGIKRSVQLSAGEVSFLWDLYCKGDENALKKLLEYNKADVKNLFKIAKLLIPKLWEKIIKI